MKKFLSSLLILMMLITNVLSVFAEEQLKLEEVVYGILQGDGSTKEIIVSQHILGHSGDVLHMKSTLSNIKPLMDDLIITEKAGDLTIQSHESELYFRGNTIKELPIKTSITYTLDGQEMKAETIIGKSGHLKILVKQENMSQIIVEGKKGEKVLYLPFETAIVTNLSNDIFSNVSISSGKIIDDGHLKIISAILSPGFKENFNLLDSKFIVDELVIEADVENLELSGFYMTTLCKLPEVDFDKLTANFTDSFTEIDGFEAASNQLVKGSEDLESGTAAYFGKQEEALQAFDTYLNKDQLLLNSVLNFSDGVAGFNQAFDLYSRGVLDLIQGINQLKEGSTGVNGGLLAFKNQLSQVMPESETTKPLYQGLNQIILSMNQLDQGLESAKTSGNILKEKTQLLMASNLKIKEGNEKIKYSTTQLLNANLQVMPVISQLKEGSKAYSVGVTSFNQGVRQFKTEGVDVLIDEVETALVKAETFKSNYQMLKKIADDYNSFSGPNNSIDGSVVFILKTESLNKK